MTTDNEMILLGTKIKIVACGVSKELTEITEGQKRHCLDKHGLIKLFIISLSVAAEYIPSFK